MTNEEINKLIAELEKLKTPEPEGIEIPACGWMFDANGKIEKSYQPKDFLENGNKRTTIKACELASKRMIRVNRLSLLAHILGVEKEFVEGGYNYYVYKSTGRNENKWDINSSAHLFYPDRIYMNKEGAKSVANILNNNEFSLELEDE